MYQREKSYQSLLKDEHDDNITSSSTSTCCRCERDGIELNFTKRNLWSRAWILTVFNLILLGISATLFAWSASGFAESMHVKNKNWRDVNEYSPVIDQIEIPLETRRMNSSFLDIDHDIYRQFPSPAVDEAWDALTMHGVAYVSREDAIKMGWDVEIVAKLAPELNVGDDAYAAETDIIHKIHCLNMVRKDLYFDYYWGSMYPEGKPSERHQLHTNHCLYILLQSLMCDANTDLIPQVWMEDYPWPTPDFNINRKCGNLDGVREWERTHRVPHDERYSKIMIRPEGQKGLPISNEFRRVFEVGT